MRPVRAASTILAIGVMLPLAACATTTTSGGASSPAATTVSIANCGENEDFPSPAQRLFVNDGNMIATALAVGAEKQIVGVTSMDADKAALSQVYGKATVDALPDLGNEYMSLETVLAKRPDVVYAGYNYGFSEAKNFMPKNLREHKIAPYILSESCRPKSGDKQRGTMDPWTALRTDLTNLGKITGHEEQATKVAADIDARLTKLKAAPAGSRKPVVLLYDSSKDGVFTSGSFGGPQGIIDAAGAANLAADVKDTWVNISWEKVAAGKPDYIVFVDYPGQTMKQKIEALEQNPATRDLPAVKQQRYLALPYASWTSSPLNIDAAEQVRQSLEAANLLPASGTKPVHDLHTPTN